MVRIPRFAQARSRGFSHAPELGDIERVQKVQLRTRADAEQPIRFCVFRGELRYELRCCDADR